MSNIKNTILHLTLSCLRRHESRHLSPLIDLNRELTLAILKTAINMAGTSPFRSQQVFLYR